MINNIFKKLWWRMQTRWFPQPGCNRLLMTENPYLTQFEIGDKSYGKPTILFSNSGTTLKIGKYVSIADDVVIMLGGDHRTDWITTYPLNKYFPEWSTIEGHPTTKGDVVIGNDVWIGREALILSGVTIGNGAVVGTRAVVTKNVMPYSIVAGNPARHIRFRFDAETISELSRIAWWDWSDEIVQKAVPYLLSNNTSALIDFNYTRLTKVQETEIMMNVNLENKPCPLGCGKNDEIVITGRDLLHNLPGEFTVVKCHTCGLMRTNPRPTPNTIGFYYPDDYGPYQGTKVKTAATPNKKPLWLRRLGRQLFEFNSGRLPILQSGRMLEIGCASGAFMHQMAKNGWEVEGIEFSPMAAENTRALGYPVHIGSLETAPDPQQLYDLVVGWMVLEHLHDPILALQKLHRWTKPGGWLVISIPNAGSLEFSVFKEAWYALQLPTHLYHYTPTTLGKILDREGWKMIKVHHHRTLNNLFPSIGYKLREHGLINSFTESLIKFPEKARKIHFFLYPIAFILSMIGQTGRMTVWARKEHD